MHAHAHAIGALEGGRRSAMALMPALVAWWEPGRGMTVSEASFPAGNLLDTWTLRAGQTLDVAQEDPYGGTAGWKLTEGAGGSLHDVYAAGRSPANWVSGPTTVTCYGKSSNRGLTIFEGVDGNPYGAFNLSDGTTYSVTDGATATSEDAGNGWWKCSIYHPSGWANSPLELLLWKPGTGYSYAGDGASFLHLYLSAYVQHRCSALADHSGHGYHFAQSTPANQMFVLKADRSSPGDYLWLNRACVWNPGDNAKTAVCTESGLCTAMTTDHTFVADVYITAAATAAVPLLATEGGVAIQYIIDTSRRLVATCGTSLVGTALSVGRHRIAVRREGNTFSLFADGVIDGSPTELTPGGAINPTSVTLTQRCMGFLKGGLSGAAMSDAQIAAEHAAMLREAP